MSNYKVYEPNPHLTLEQIKVLLEEEKYHRAWILCQQYFTGLETNAHIRKALERAAKEDVYNYMVEKMKAPRNFKQEEEHRNIYESTTKELKEQERSYAVAKAAMEEFCTDNSMDLDSMVKQFEEKHKKLTREELIEANKAVAARQAGKFAKPSQITPTPSSEELDTIANEAVKYNEDIASQQLEISIDK